MSDHDKPEASDAEELVLPENLPEQGILVGWSLEREHARSPLGFQIGDPNCCPEEGFVAPILFEGGGHLLTIAPTGAGKGTGCIIPALLRYNGSVVVVDPKGEAAAVTANRRRALGQEVHVLDPMGLTSHEGGSFNPLDMVHKDSADAVDDAAIIAELLIDSAPRDPSQNYINGRAVQLMTALFLMLIHDRPEAEHNLGGARALLHGPDNSPAPLFDAMRNSASADARDSAHALSLMPPQTLGPVIATAIEALDLVRNASVEKATATSSFNLDAFVRGDPISLFLVVPPGRFGSHGRLLRLWAGTLLAAVSQRLRKPKSSTLFLIDEAVQLGHLPQLGQGIMLLQDFGVQIWTFWQDVSQLRELYPQAWRSMVNNCRVQQAFGATNMVLAHEIAALTGFSRPYDILELKAEEMILLLAGDEAVVALRPNYLRDLAFSGLFDENPFHEGSGRIVPERRKPERLYERPKTPSPQLPILDPTLLERLTALSEP